MSRFIDITGRKFGLLTARSFQRRMDGGGNFRFYWMCDCECGKSVEVMRENLGKGSISCGCQRRKDASARLLRHGLSRTKAHTAWAACRARCYATTNKSYPDYGARGITVCKRWRDSFENFFADMGNPPSPQHSLERKDNDGPYSPQNCIWALPVVQCNNQRTNVRFMWNGRWMTLAQIGRMEGISYDRLHSTYSRIKQPIEHIVSVALKNQLRKQTA